MDIHVRYQVAWVAISIFLFNIMVNLTVVVKEAIKGLIEECKRKKENIKDWCIKKGFKCFKKTKKGAKSEKYQEESAIYPELDFLLYLSEKQPAVVKVEFF
jgi:hypothetical protein